VPPTGASGLARFDAMTTQDAERALLSCCSSPRWTAAVAAGRPYGDLDSLCAAADSAVAALTDDDLDEALAGHPRIGERLGGENDSQQSRREQSGASGASTATLAALAAGNLEYEERFGHVYLVCATGLSGDELLARLRSRLGNDRATERSVVRAELAKINRLRLQRLVAGMSA
jgi:2-oxo-4-hydroxy-4-carboxy-5-ureidoimidazoline decarboxylase